MRSACAPPLAGTLTGRASRGPPPGRAPLSREEQARYAAGQQQFTTLCAGCHQPNGRASPGVAKSLVGSRWALAPAAQVIRIVLHGKEGEMLMPPVGGSMTDEQIATCSPTCAARGEHRARRRSTPTTVREIRGATAGRKKAWTEAELAAIRR